jgi:hypothetical protein
MIELHIVACNAEAGVRHISPIPGRPSASDAPACAPQNVRLDLNDVEFRITCSDVRSGGRATE